ncbi:hypothetical protein SUDANB135_00206 [Streptomyces sp. SudanB135_2055]
MAHPACGRLPGHHDPRLPRLLPPVLQPPRPAAPHRPVPRAAHAAARLPPAAQRRPDGQLRTRPEDTASQRARIRRAQPHLRPAGPGRHGPSGRPPAARRARARGLRTLRRGHRHRLPGRHPLPRGRAPPGVRGVLPQLLRRSARAVRSRTVADVPHLLPRVGRGPALRRTGRALSAGALGPSRRLPPAPRCRHPHRNAGARRASRRRRPRRRSARAHRRRHRAPRRRGAGPRPRATSPGRRRFTRPGHLRLARERRGPAHRTALPRLPALARPAGAR